MKLVYLTASPLFSEQNSCVCVCVCVRARVRVCARAHALMCAVHLCVLFCHRCPLLLSLHLLNISSYFFQNVSEVLNSCVSIFLNSPQVHVLHHRSPVICCLPSTSVFPRSAGVKAAWISNLWAGPRMTIHFG